MNTVDPLYVAARRVLLDALEALAPHGDAVVIAGAQAIYLRTGHGGLAVAPYVSEESGLLSDATQEPSPVAFGGVALAAEKDRPAGRRNRNHRAERLEQPRVAAILS
jgi:hypothetical protein